MELHLFYGEKNIITSLFLRGVIDLHWKNKSPGTENSLK